MTKFCLRLESAALKPTFLLGLVAHCLNSKRVPWMSVYSRRVIFPCSSVIMPAFMRYCCVTVMFVIINNGRISSRTLRNIGPTVFRIKLPFGFARKCSVRVIGNLRIFSADRFRTSGERWFFFSTDHRTARWRVGAESAQKCSPCVCDVINAAIENKIASLSQFCEKYEMLVIITSVIFMAYCDFLIVKRKLAIKIWQSMLWRLYDHLTKLNGGLQNLFQ